MAFVGSCLSRVGYFWDAVESLVAAFNANSVITNSVRRSVFPYDRLGELCFMSLIAITAEEAASNNPAMFSADG